MIDKVVHPLGGNALLERYYGVSPKESDPREAAFLQEEERLSSRVERLPAAQKEVLARELPEAPTEREKRLLRAGLQRLREGILSEHPELAEVLAVEATKRAPKCAAGPCRARVSKAHERAPKEVHAFCASCRSTILNRWYNLKTRGNPWKRTLADVVEAVRKGETFLHAPLTRKGLKTVQKGRPADRYSISGHARRLGVSRTKLRDILDFVGCPPSVPGVSPEFTRKFVDRAMEKWERWLKLPLNKRRYILAMRKTGQTPPSGQGSAVPRCAAKACPNKMPTRKTSRSPDLQKFCRGCVENLCKDLWHAQRRGSMWSREEIIAARVRGERLPTGVMAGARRLGV